MGHLPQDDLPYVGQATDKSVGQVLVPGCPFTGSRVTPGLLITGSRVSFFVRGRTHDAEDLRNRPFLDRKAALARRLRGTQAGSRSTTTLPRTGPPISSTPAGL